MQTKTAKIIKTIAAILLAVATVVLTVRIIVGLQKSSPVAETLDVHFVRDIEAAEEEDYDGEEDTVCPAAFVSDDGKYECTVNYTFEQWEALDDTSEFDGKVYIFEDGRCAAFDHEATEAELSAAIRDLNSDELKWTYSTTLALALMTISVLVMVFFGRHFTNYEQIWFLSIMAIACVVSVIAPEEDMNGFVGIAIMALYLADIFLNILCELLISKQSKWNFIVSVAVEITEIVTLLILASRFATMAVTLFFWLPIDIASFVNWHKHPDRQQDELTRVRKLSGWAEVAIIAGIALWTVLVGMWMSNLNISTDLFGGNKTIETWVVYLDACASAVGICNGLFIFFRIREQWIAWYICAALEAIINILCGQWVLLVLKVGYFTNTTYGYLKWTRYIKAHKGEEKKSLL